MGSWITRIGVATSAMVGVVAVFVAPAMAAPAYQVGDTVAVNTLVDNGSIVLYRVKFAKRICPTFAEVPSNINQSANAESALPVTGPNPYSSAAAHVEVNIEDAPGRAWASCTPATGWKFEIGTGVAQVDGLSRVANPDGLVWIDNGDETATLSTSIVTGPHIWDVVGGAAIFLTPAQYAEAAAGTLRTSEIPHPGATFATLRCGDERTGGANSQRITLHLDSSPVPRTLCYAYNSVEQPPPPPETTTTTTTVPATTTTTTTTPGPTTAPSTSQSPAIVTPAPTTSPSSVAGVTVTSPGAVLPRTGTGSPKLTVFGLLALLSGIGLVLLNRRWTVEEE